MLAKHCLPVVFLFVFTGSFVSHVFANSPPRGPTPLPMKPIECLMLVGAEFFGLLIGVGILTHTCKTQWQKATMNVAIALVASYLIGVAIWTSGYVAGIPLYNPLVIPSESPPNVPGLIITLLPELIGTVVGGIIIYVKQRVYRTTAFGTMTAAMLTSLFLGSLMTSFYFSL